MAMTCRNGCRECDGCMDCQDIESVIICDDCGGNIYESDGYYSVCDRNICDECIDIYRRIA